MKELPVTRFKRELNSLIKKLTSDTNPLTSILVTRNGKPTAVVKMFDEDEELKVVIESREGQSEIKVNIDEI